MITYIVKYGDWLAKIAEDHGTTVGAIWNHPGNAEHRAKRGSPDVLYPGDVLQIPVAAAAAPAEPATPAPVAPPAEPTPPGLDRPWPYPPYEGPFSTKPTWECPGGTCECHPVPEDEPKDEHVIVIYDPQGKRMPGARCRVYEAGRLITPDPTSSDGAGEIRVQLRASTSTVRVEWAPSDLPPNDRLPYAKAYHVKMSDETGDVGLDRRLANLGFSRGRRREDNVRDYQRAYGREPTGNARQIRLEVLERHDSGTVEVFHPHEAREDAPVQSSQSRSLFGSPPTRPTARSGGLGQDASPRLGLAPDGDGGGGGAGDKTESGQNAKGSLVPDRTDMLLWVALEKDFPDLDPTKIELQVRALDVPGMPAEQRDKNVEPTVPGTLVPGRTVQGVVIPAHVAYGFKDMYTGKYSISAYMKEAPAEAGKGTIWALGYTQVELKMGLLTIGYVGMKRSHPVYDIDDPILDVDCPPMQMRRKLLATIYNLFPLSQDYQAAKKGIKPPYGQGDYKPMYLGGVIIVEGKPKHENTCAATNGACITTAGASGFGKDIRTHPSFVRYQPNTAPSIGDTVYYGTEDKFEHMGIVVHSGPQSGHTWICADGGPPDRTSEFKKGAKGGWGRFWHAPDYEGPASRESAWFVARWFRVKDGQPEAIHAWAKPAITDKTHGYPVLGWSDLTHPSRPALRPKYDKKNSADAYRACKRRINDVRAAALGDQLVCRAEMDSKEGKKAPSG